MSGGFEHCAAGARRVGAPRGAFWVACKRPGEGILIDFRPIDTSYFYQELYVKNINLDSLLKRAIMGFDGKFGNLGRNQFYALLT
jgi:hypothetical protein